MATLPTLYTPCFLLYSVLKQSISSSGAGRFLHTETRGTGILWRVPHALEVPINLLQLCLLRVGRANVRTAVGGLVGATCGAWFTSLNTVEYGWIVTPVPYTHPGGFLPRASTAWSATAVLFCIVLSDTTTAVNVSAHSGVKSRHCFYMSFIGTACENNAKICEREARVRVLAFTALNESNIANDEGKKSRTNGTTYDR